MDNVLDRYHVLNLNQNPKNTEAVTKISQPKTKKNKKKKNQKPKTKNKNKNPGTYV